MTSPEPLTPEHILDRVERAMDLTHGVVEHGKSGTSELFLQTVLGLATEISDLEDTHLEASDFNDKDWSKHDRQHPISAWAYCRVDDDGIDVDDKELTSVVYRALRLIRQRAGIKVKQGEKRKRE